MNAKIFFEGQIRRTTLEVAPTFDSLRQKLAKLFSEPSIEELNAFHIRYQDEDGDLIDMSTDEELSDAIKWVKTYQQVIHIHIARKEKKEEKEKKQSEEKKEIPRENEENPFAFVEEILQNVNVEQFKPFVNQLENIAKEYLGTTDPNELISQVENLFKPVEVKQAKEAPVEEEKKEEAPKPVHFAMCDGCRKRIVGVRHKCRACADYDLCENCILDKETVHPKHDFQSIERPENMFMPAKVVSADVIHRAICDSCQDRIVGLRFKCEGCRDYDLCGLCFQNQEEIHPGHSFRIIEKNERFCGARPCCFAPVQPVQPVQQVEVPYDNSVVPLEESDSSDDEEVKVVAEPLPEPEIRDSQIQHGMTREKLQDALKQLQEMGFSDREKNVRLIIQNQGDVVATILNLLNQA